jgi:hypothetical protein
MARHGGVSVLRVKHTGRWPEEIARAKPGASQHKARGKRIQYKGHAGGKQGVNHLLGK